MAAHPPDKVRIEPVALGSPSTRRAPGRGPRFPIRGVLAGLAGLVLVGGAAAVLTFKPVTLDIDPAPDTLEVRGGWARVTLGGNLYARPGTYAVRASKAGFMEVTETVEVKRSGVNHFAFSLQPLPGRIGVAVFGRIEGEPPLPEAMLRVEGQAVEKTDFALAAGNYGLDVSAPRYQILRTNLVVEGMGKRQSVRIGLDPGWATLRVRAAVEGAEVLVDDDSRGTSPQSLELDPGTYRIGLRAAGYQPFATQVVVRAGETIHLEDIAMAEANARLMVRSAPAGALVSLDGAYQGQTPMTIEMSPGMEHTVRLSKAGFRDEQRTVSGRPDEASDLSVEMTPVQGVVRFEVEPPDAALTVDRKAWGAIPAQIELSAAEHEIEIQHEGYRPHRQTLRPKPGLVQVVKVRLTPVAPVTGGVPGPSAAPRETERATSTGYVLQRVEPGSFRMGASRREQGRRSNETLVNVVLRRPFFMGSKEVTNAEFRKFDPAHNSGRLRNVSFNRGEQPVVKVSWVEAARYCNWLSGRDGLPEVYRIEGDKVFVNKPLPSGYRMPTEAEWAYCARAAGRDDLLKYPWGSGFPPREVSGNYADASAASLLARVLSDYKDGHVASTAPGSFEANPVGLYDLGGNVAEWCHDRYGIYPHASETEHVDPVGAEEGDYHVIRGSGWKHSSISALRLSYRDYGAEGRNDVGFRVCRYADVEGAP